MKYIYINKYTLRTQIFAGTKFRGFRGFAQIREIKSPRNFSKSFNREIKFKILIIVVSFFVLL